MLIMELRLSGAVLAEVGQFQRNILQLQPAAVWPGIREHDVLRSLKFFHLFIQQVFLKKVWIQCQSLVYLLWVG